MDIQVLRFKESVDSYNRRAQRIALSKGHLPVHDHDSEMVMCMRCKKMGMQLLESCEPKIV